MKRTPERPLKVISKQIHVFQSVKGDSLLIASGNMPSGVIIVLLASQWLQRGRHFAVEGISSHFIGKNMLTGARLSGIYGGGLSL
jgi:hypothetical protein